MDEHEDEEEAKTPEQRAAIKRIKGKMDDIMADMAETMLDQDTRDGIEKNLKELFAEHGISFSFIQMNAFLMGMEFGIASSSKDTKMAMMVMIVLRSLVEKRKANIKAATPKI